MTGIPLQPGIIYGPIRSRRLGRSLGINLLGSHGKACSFDCVYCQYGAAKAIESIVEAESLPTTDQILLEVEKALRKPRTIEFLTFSGNGEPTMHPDFPQIVEGVKSLRDQIRPGARLAILSNSSGVIHPEVFTALTQFDTPMMKLDAGDEQTFGAINRPAQAINFWEIVEGLKKLPNLIIQSMLVDGEISNVCGKPFKNWVKVLLELNPNEIHIYTIERPTAVSGLKPVSAQKLNEIELELLSHYNLPVKAY